MNLRKTFLAAAVLGGLLLYIRLVELPREEVKLLTTQPYSGVSPQQFVEIQIRRGGETFRFINTEPVTSTDGMPTPDPLAAASVDRSKSWRLADVGGGALDKGAINSVLNSLVGLTLGEPLPRKELDTDPAVYGLKEPGVTLSVKRGDDVREIRFGLLNEYVAKRYVGIGEEIFLVADGLFTAVDKERTQFRNRNPIDFADSDVAAVTLRSPAQELRFESDDSYRWQLTRPVQFRASDTAMAGLGRALRNLRAADFIDSPEALARYGLDTPKLTATIEFRKDTRPEPLVVLIGSAAGEGGRDTFMKVGAEGTIMRLASDPIDTIMKRPDDFRDRAIFRFPKDRVVAVTIDRPGVEPLQLERTEGGWIVNGLAGDRPFVEQVVRNLSSLEAAAFAPPGSNTGFEKPTATFTVTVQGEKAGDEPTKHVLVVGARSMDGKVETGYYGRTEDLKEPFVLSSETFKLLTPLQESLVKAIGEDAAVSAPKVEASPRSE
ncbi:MAG: hypothetical protein RL417_2545 [Pseudomonadota bacterium]|jgi:hypothetical protein